MALTTIYSPHGPQRITHQAYKYIEAEPSFKMLKISLRNRHRDQKVVGGMNAKLFASLPYLDTIVDKLLYLVHGPGSQQLLLIGGWAHVPRVQEVQQLLSCSKPATVLRYQILANISPF
jgi:hypothetical protein